MSMTLKYKSCIHCIFLYEQNHYLVKVTLVLILKQCAYIM